MKSRTAAFALFLLLLPPRLAAEDWTVERAVAVAQERSPDAGIARARMAAAQAFVDQARATSRPQLTLQSRYTQTNSPHLAFGSILNQRAFQPGIDFNHPGTIDNLNVTGGIAYTLYNGGRAAAQRSGAKADVFAAEHDLQAVRQQLAAEVVKAVLNLRTARETISTVDAGVRAQQAAADTARLRFDAGQILKTDLLSLEVQLAQTRESAAIARQDATLAEQTFRYVLGLETSADPVDLAPNDERLAQLALPDTRDFSRRPELLGLQEKVRAAEAALRAAEGGRRPTLNAFANYSYDHGLKLDRGADSWLAGVSVDVAIFDGGHGSARVRQGVAELTQAREMLRKATLGVELEVKRAAVAHAAAVERVAVTGHIVEQAEESAALSRARFERESMLAADLMGAESRLLDARLRRTLALADERRALVELRRAVGAFPFPLSPNSQP